MPRPGLIGQALRLGGVGKQLEPIAPGKGWASSRCVTATDRSERSNTMARELVVP